MLIAMRENERPLATVTVPGLVMKNLTNQREHWSDSAGRARLQRTQSAMMTRLKLQTRGVRSAVEQAMGNGGLVVHITRIAKRSLDEGDNLPASAKHVRDGVSDALEVDDADKRVSWTYEQKAGEPAVTIDIFPRSVCECCGAYRVREKTS